MKRYRISPRWFLLFVCLFQPSCSHAQDDHTDHHVRTVETRKLGHVVFPNSGNAAAQKSFLEGLALIHSFEYDDAQAAFESAERADKNFALPYWMEALTNTQLIWGIDNVAAARAVLNRLGPNAQARLARARTPRERAFAGAVEAFYADGSQKDRTVAFADSLRHWAQMMPTDLEAHAFASLGILWQSQFVEGDAAQRLKVEAAKQAQYVFDRNPLHPGAAHYIIHATDAPATARLGLRAALEYSRIAPDAEHAVHMPSHIFLPLGMWDELVIANERAWKASRAAAARQGFQPWGSDWHGLNWLQYGYLQQGRWKAARALIDTARRLTKGIGDKVKPADDPDASLAVEQLAFRYGAETGDWSEFPSVPMTFDLNDPNISQRARGMATVSLYQRAVVAFKTRHDSAAVRAAIATIGNTRPAIRRILESELSNVGATNSKRIETLEALRPLTRVDRYASMTPSPFVNVDEALGAALVADGRATDAVRIYREALEDRPRRAASLLGLARAQEAAGDKAGARATYAELSKMWVRADPDVRTLLH
ncbi:MAG: tol-pal system YbgF family protein [Gemmatimonadaceae bacterium]